MTTATALAMVIVIVIVRVAARRMENAMETLRLSFLRYMVSP